MKKGEWCRGFGVAGGSGEENLGPKLIPDHYGDKFASFESVVVQRSRAELWESVAQSQTRDGVFAGPTVAFDDFINAKHGLKMNNMLGIGGILAEFFASRGTIAEATVYSLCARRIAGVVGHTSRIDCWSDWLLQAMPKARKQLELLDLLRHLRVCSALSKLYDRVRWMAVERTTDPIIQHRFGFVLGA